MKGYLRCEGSGEIERVLTPQLDPRDPMWSAEDIPCPGCPDCLMGELLSDVQELELKSRPEKLVFEITADGIRLVGEGSAQLGSTFLDDWRIILFA